MNTRSALPLLFVLILSLSGCVALRGGPELPRPPATAISDPMYLMDGATFKKYNDETDEDRRVVIRNEIIDERMLEIDYQFRTYEEELWKQGVGHGIGTDWILLALSGATATIGGQTLKAALGAASTGVQGARSSFDKYAYYEKTLPALMAQMSAERRKIRAEIGKRKELPATDYSLYAAVSDLNDYFRAGTIYGSIAVIASDAGKKEAKAQDEINKLTEGKFLKDDASDLLRHFWKPDGSTIDSSNEAALLAWMAANRLDTGAGSITMFLSTEEMAELRSKAVEELIDN